jgi:hypothetical protein
MSLDPNLFSGPSITSNLQPNATLDQFSSAAEDLQSRFAGVGTGQPAGQPSRGFDTLPAVMGAMGGAPVGSEVRSIVDAHAAAFRAAGAEVGYSNSYFPLPDEARSLMPGGAPIYQQVVSDSSDGMFRPPHHSVVLALDSRAYTNNPVFGNAPMRQHLLPRLPCFISNENSGADAQFKTDHVRDLPAMNAALFAYTFKMRKDAARWSDLLDSAFGVLTSGSSLALNEAAIAGWAASTTERVPAHIALSGQQWSLLGVADAVMPEGTQPIARFTTNGLAEMLCIWPAGDDRLGRVHPAPGTTLWLVLAMRFRIQGSVKTATESAEEQRAYTEATGQVLLPPTVDQPNAEFYLRWEPVVTLGPEPPIHHVSGPMSTMLHAVRVGTVQRNINQPSVLRTYSAFTRALVHPVNASYDDLMLLAQSDRVPRISVMLETAYNGIASVAPLRRFNAEVPAICRGVNHGLSLSANLLVSSVFNPTEVVDGGRLAAYGSNSVVRRTLALS